MNVLVRADASVALGSGHVMRCLTLADQLRAEGADVLFACRALSGSLFDVLDARGYRYVRLEVTPNESWQQHDAEDTLQAAAPFFPEGVDWAIVDHYGLDAFWERGMRPFAKRVMAIDDLANRNHDCQLLLDQNLYENMENRYDGLVPAECIRLTGPHYALVRPEFLEARRALRERSGTVRRILVIFGGSDPSNETSKTIRALLLLNRSDIEVDVVVGGASPHREEVEALCRRLPQGSFHCQANNMAELMANADLAIGGGGSTTWERCIMALPSIVMSVAENQVAIARATDCAGASLYLGEAHLIDAALLAQHILRVLSDPPILRKMARKASNLVDGGGACRITSLMRE